VTASFDQQVALARAAYAAFNRGDFDAVLPLLDPDVTWQRRPMHPVQGTYRGRAEVARDVVGAMREQYSELTLEPIEFHEVGEHLVVRLHQRGRGRASGAVVEGELVHVVRMSGDLVTELRAFSTVDEALAALEAAEGS